MKVKNFKGKLSSKRFVLEKRSWKTTIDFQNFVHSRWQFSHNLLWDLRLLLTSIQILLGLAYLIIFPWSLIPGIGLLLFAGIFYLGFEILVRRSFESACFEIESMGFLALNEFIAILESTKSLGDAVEFISESDYPLISNVCSEAISQHNLGKPLSITLQAELELNCYSEIRELFLRVIDLWETAPETISLFSKSIEDKIRAHMEGETEKIDSNVSLIGGVGSIFPVFFVSMMMISGILNIYLAMLFSIFLIALAYVGKPWPKLIHQGHRESIDGFAPSSLISVMGEQLQGGNTFDSTLLNILRSLKKISNQRQSEIDFLASTLVMTLPRSLEVSERLLATILGSRLAMVFSLARKFSSMDNIVAGRRLMEISQSFFLTESVLKRRLAKIKAERTRLMILHILSSFALGFLFHLSPLLSTVSLITKTSFPWKKGVNLTPFFDFTVFFQLFFINLAASNIPANTRIDSYRRIGYFRELVLYSLIFLISVFFSSLLFPY